MARWLVYLLFGLGYAMLALGWALVLIWPFSLGLLCLAGLGLFAVKKKFHQALDLGFALGVMAAATGISLEMPFPYALGAVLSLLAAWDIDHFSRRLTLAASQDDPRAMLGRHLGQLGLVLLVGLAASLIVLEIRFQFNFELAIGLVLLVFASLAALINWLRKTER